MPGTYVCAVQVVKRRSDFVREGRLVCFGGVLVHVVYGCRVTKFIICNRGVVLRMDHSETIQDAGPMNTKENAEVDNSVERNDCDGESLFISAIVRAVHGYFV
jgi:hypothetical protein